MKELILIMCKLRKVKIFKVIMSLVLLTLMMLGVWVATKELKLVSKVGVNDKLIHIVVFFGFALLIDLACLASALWKGFLLLFYGVFIEFMQYFTPFRYFSIADILADIFGILLYFYLKEFVLGLLGISEKKETDKKTC